MRSSPSRTALWFSMLAASVFGCAPAQSHPESAAPSVTGADFQNTPNEPIELTLQRKVSGLRVIQTDGGIALQVRGSSGYNGDSRPPLFILNGSPFTPGPGGALTGINPYDIDTIKVLKGAEAGLYGIEGANGVILITMKTGPKSKP